VLRFRRARGEERQQLKWFAYAASLTLVYGLLTAILWLGYAGAVLVLGPVFGEVARDPPSWVVAGGPWP
jgi:hypothetical protein